MSDDSDDLIGIIYFDGMRYFGPSGQVFERDRKMFRMSPRCKYTDLKKIIYKKLRLRPPQKLSRLIARCASGNPVHWVAVEVVDDDDLALVIDAYRGGHGESSFIELYAEVDSGGQASTQQTVTYIDGIDINREPPVNEEEMYMSPTPPPPPPMSLEMNPTNDMYDATLSTDSSDDEVDEGLVPNSDSSDTDVDGDFDRIPSTTVSLPIPSPGIVGMQQQPQSVPG